MAEKGEIPGDRGEDFRHQLFLEQKKTQTNNKPVTYFTCV